MFNTPLLASVRVPASVPEVQPMTPLMTVLDVPRSVPEFTPKSALLLTVIGPATSAFTSSRQKFPPVWGISTMSLVLGARLRSQLVALLQLPAPPTLIHV